MLAVICGAVLGLRTYWLVVEIGLDVFEGTGGNDNDDVAFASGITTAKDKNTKCSHLSSIAS